MRIDSPYNCFPSYTGVPADALLIHLNPIVDNLTKISALIIVGSRELHWLIILYIKNCFLLFIFNLLPFNFIKHHFIYMLQKSIKMVWPSLCSPHPAPASSSSSPSSWRSLKTWYTLIQELIYSILVLKVSMFLGYLSSGHSHCKADM